MSFRNREKAIRSERESRRRRNQHKLNLDVLEVRQLFSNFPVTSAADDGSDGTLRSAVAQANTASSPSWIEFELGTSSATITLAHGLLELSNTALFDHDLRWTGRGAGDRSAGTVPARYSR